MDFLVEANEDLFCRLKKETKEHECIKSIVQNTTMITVSQVEDWKKYSKSKISKELYDDVIQYLREQYKISVK